MTEHPNLDPLPDLSDGLAELDEELRDLRMAERSSFEPELRAEMERSWRDGEAAETGSPVARWVLAGGVGVVVFAGMLAPPARAGIAEISRQSLRLLGVEDVRQGGRSLRWWGRTRGR